MKNVPPSVRAALKKRGADAILQQEGDYYDFKSQIDQIIHQGEDVKPELGDPEPMEGFEEELSPEEQKATERIEQLGDKYSPMNEFSGPDKDGPSYAQLDAMEDDDEDIKILEDDDDFAKMKNKESEGRWKELEDKGKEMRNHLLEKVGGYWQDNKSNEQIKDEYKQTLKEDFGLNDQEANAVIKKYMDFASGGLEFLAWNEKRNMVPEDYDIKDLEDDVKSKPERPGMPEHHWEEPDDSEKERHIVIDEGPHKGERYDNEEDYKNSNKNDKKGLVKDTLVDKFNDAHLYNDGGKFQLALGNGETKEFDTKNEAIDYLSEYSNKDYSWAKDKEAKSHEDFEDVRYYPVSDEDRKKAGPRYLGRYHSIKEAMGLDDFYRGEEKQEPYKEHSIYKLPDGYFSTNPNITQMSFRTREALEDYIDNEYGDYNTIERFEGDYPVFRKGKDEKTGKEYDYEPVDRYLEVGKQRQASNAFNNAVGKFIDSNGSDQDLDESINTMKKLGYSDDEILRKVLTMFKGTIK